MRDRGQEFVLSIIITPETSWIDEGNSVVHLQVESISSSPVSVVEQIILEFQFLQIDPFRP